MKTILCPIDFSASSFSALEFAARLGDKLSASIELLHVITEKDFDAILSEEDAGKDLEKKIELIRTKMEKLEQQIKKDISKNLNLHYTIKEGNLISLIIETENELYIDLIVMGTKGVSDIAEAYFGSNTLQVIKESSCPVFCIPEGTSINDLTRLVYAYDYQKEDVYALKEVITLAANLNATVDVVHINNEESKEHAKHVLEPDKDIRTYFDSPGVNFVYKYYKGSVHDGLNQYLRENKVDILALLKKKRNFIAEIFHKSITQYFAYYTDIPVLVFKY